MNFIPRFDIKDTEFETRGLFSFGFYIMYE